MKYPAMSKQREMSVAVPPPDGGVNYTDMPYEVADNQLTECKNMWWHKGSLRTRPGVEEAEGRYGYATGQRISEQETLLITKPIGDSGRQEIYADSLIEEEDGPMQININGIYSTVASTTGTPPPTDALFAKKGETYYMYLNDGRTFETTGYHSEWKEATPYAPLVMINGKGTEDTSGAPATNEESHNRLTGAFRYQFCTDGKSNRFYLTYADLTHLQNETAHVTLALQLDGKYQTLDFELPEKTEDTYTWCTVKGVDPALLNYTMYGQLPEVENTGAPVHKIDLTCNLDYKEGCVYFDGTVYYTDEGGEKEARQTPIPLPKVSGNESNNLEVKVWKTDKEKQRFIGNMTQSVWFGGDRSGVGGGTRLFVAGNPDEPNMVCWSYLNNPLYFPDTNYAYIGNADQAVTGFSKQADKLIIFKEHEIYSAQYASVAVTDTGAGISEGAQFPITPVHSTIGCDCPHTIRLVNNQLVWLNSNGHVYTLPTVNQYDENNVRDVSLLIQRALQEHSKEELRAATATEYMGYYLLAVGKRIYMMNAECSAFASVHYYSSKERAQRAIPWYVWDIPHIKTRILGMSAKDNGLRIAQEGQTPLVILGGATDMGEPIHCSFTTKAFNFGSLDRRKAVNQLYLSATAQSPLKMRLSYITDRFTAEDADILEGEGNPEDMKAENYKVYRVTPNVHRVGLFALRVDCDGAMAVNGLKIKYKNEGVTR